MSVVFYRDGVIIHGLNFFVFLKLVSHVNLLGFKSRMTSCNHARELNLHVFSLTALLLYSLVVWRLLGLLKGHEKTRDSITRVQVKTGFKAHHQNNETYITSKMLKAMKRRYGVSFP